MLIMKNVWFAVSIYQSLRYIYQIDVIKGVKNERI